MKLEKKHYNFVETFVDAIISADAEGYIIYCNPAAKKMFGYENDIVGKNITILMPERFRVKYRIGMNRYVSTGLTSLIGRTVELTGLKKDGTEFPVELSLSVCTVDNNCHFISTIRDITQRKHMELTLLESNKKLKNLSMKDSLTNLYNRRYMYEVLEKEFRRAKRYRNNLSCIMVDVDYFKNINDLYGHPFGDKVLIDFSSFLCGMARSTDIVSRYGGEEFFIILPDVSIHGAVDFAERLKKSIAKRRIEDKEENIAVLLSISAGVSSFSRYTLNKEVLVNQADMALYEAKRLGRNRICCYRHKKTAQKQCVSQ
ncbi:MAG: sensor domain-containing diguanylate cyclase [wastewater metagenome]|nr:sensor domain-containing diguanylate cyclase [Candidatus Loosdrechtia aerotolerans]